MVQKYIKKPIVIEAVQFTDDSIKTIMVINNFMDWNELKVNYDKNVPFIIIPTLEGNMKADIGDYIIKGINGEFYPCKPDIFAKTYDVYKDTK